MRNKTIVWLVFMLAAAMMLCIGASATQTQENEQPTQPTAAQEDASGETLPVGENEKTDDGDDTQHVCRYEQIVTPPDCTNEGYTTYTCACGDSYVADRVAPLGHDYGAWKQLSAPTCTTDGAQTHTCERCGHSEKQTLPRLGHEDQVTVTPATCTRSGYTTHTCRRCLRTYTDQIVPRLEHAYGDWTVIREASCTAEGQKKRVCADCGSFENASIPPHGHDMGDWFVTKGSGTSVRRRECKNCDYYEEEEISEQAHEYVAEVTAPTCTKGGYTTYRCTVCGHTYTADETRPLGHNYTETVTAPTCTQEGKTTCICMTCGHSYEKDITPAAGHTFGQWYTEKEATAEQDGTQRRDCQHCAYSERRSIAATGTTEPTVPPTEPTEPTEPPTQPTESIDPTAPTIDPTAPPTEPIDPTAPTTEPTAPTTEPTAPPQAEPPASGETPGGEEDPNLRIIWIVIGGSAAVVVLTGGVLILEALKKSRRRY